jgi:hypothetical protein
MGAGSIAANCRIWASLDLAKARFFEKSRPDPGSAPSSCHNPRLHFYRQTGLDRVLYEGAHGQESKVLQLLPQGSGKGTHGFSLEKFSEGFT